MKVVKDVKSLSIMAMISIPNKQKATCNNITFVYLHSTSKMQGICRHRVRARLVKAEELDFHRLTMYFYGETTLCCIEELDQDYIK